MPSWAHKFVQFPGPCFLLQFCDAGGGAQSNEYYDPSLTTSPVASDGYAKYVGGSLRVTWTYSHWCSLGLQIPGIELRNALTLRTRNE
jgi:hypothetical protein